MRRMLCDYYLYYCVGKQEIQQFVERHNFTKYDLGTTRNKIVNEKAAYTRRQESRLRELAEN